MGLGGGVHEGSSERRGVTSPSWRGWQSGCAGCEGQPPPPVQVRHLVGISGTQLRALRHPPHPAARALPQPHRVFPSQVWLASLGSAREISTRYVCVGLRCV